MFHTTLDQLLALFHVRSFTHSLLLADPLSAEPDTSDSLQLQQLDASSLHRHHVAATSSATSADPNADFTHLRLSAIHQSVMSGLAGPFPVFPAIVR